MISPCLGVYEKDALVQYLLNGLPMYSHKNDDLPSFRFITSNFIHQGLCRKIDIERCFEVTEASVQRLSLIHILAARGNSQIVRQNM